MKAETGGASGGGGFVVRLIMVKVHAQFVPAHYTLIQQEVGRPLPFKLTGKIERPLTSHVRGRFYNKWQEEPYHLRQEFRY